MAITSHQAEKAYEAILSAAVAGTRCPQDSREGVPGLPTGAIAPLVRAGRLRIEVYAKNWRVAEILQGPHAGARTQEPPFRHSGPYLIRDAAGSRLTGRPRLAPVKRSGPSAPRPLSLQELK